MTAGLRVERVTVRFGQAVALDEVSLDVAPGEVVALLGPSGCGKSTLLRVVAGLQPVAGGCVRWDGADLAAVPVHRRGFGLMFQDGQLFVHRDVAGNVAFGLEMARVPRPQRHARVLELLDLVGLTGFEQRAVATLSGGEQQRVALARALAPRPRLLLLDEPLSALDRSLRERLTGELAAILRRAGTTALYVTHDHDEAFAVADRVVVMAAGRILQVDTPAALWRAPASRTVAGFLGYGGFLPTRTDDGVPALLAIAPGGARPMECAPEDTRRLAGEVVASRTRRGGREMDVRLASGAVVTAVGDGARVWTPGERVCLDLLADAVVTVPATEDRTGDR